MLYIPTFFFLSLLYFYMNISYLKSNSVPVYLNVYSFCYCCNLLCGCIGLGLYHTAIQIFEIQFMFHGWAGQDTGVSQVVPRTCPYRFQQQILLGTISQDFNELDRKVIEPLKKKYISNTYDLFNNNCNHFALQMAERLGLIEKHPRSYIFRITNFANLFRCCIPDCILSGRLDWFTSKEQEKNQLKSIRNSERRHDDISRITGISSNRSIGTSRTSSFNKKAQNIQQGLELPLNK